MRVYARLSLGALNKDFLNGGILSERSQLISFGQKMRACDKNAFFEHKTAGGAPRRVKFDR